MGDRMVEANGVIGLIKYAAKRSGNKYVIGREGWKGIAVSKLRWTCHPCQLSLVPRDKLTWMWSTGMVSK